MTFSHNVAPSQPDSRAIRALLGEWSKSLAGFAKDRNTIVFTTSLEQCAGCCASAVNDVLGEVDRGKWNVNIVVLVGARFPEEVAAVRKLFKHPNVIADVKGKGWNTLATDPAAPTMFILGPAGDILARWDDMQHDPMNRGTINALRWSLQTPRTIKPSSEVKLKESGDDVILDASSPAIDGNSVLFLDPRPNMILRYSTRDGSFISGYTIDDSISLRFRHEGDNPWVWTSMQEHVSPLINLYGAAPLGASGAVRSIAMYHTGYDSTVAPDGKKMFVLRKQVGIADLVDGRVWPVKLLSEGKGYIREGIALDSSGNIIAPYFWDDGSPDLSTQTKRDSGVILARSSFADSALVPLISIREVERACNATIDPNMMVMPCVGPGGMIFFYDPTNGLLCRADSTADPSRIRLFVLWNSPAVTHAIVAGKAPTGVLPRAADSLILPGTPRMPGPLADRAVMGISASASHLDVVSIEKVGRRDAVSVRRVLHDGTIAAEVAVTRGNDVAVAAYPIGYRDGNLMMLVKWERGRWVVTGVRI